MLRLVLICLLSSIAATSAGVAVLWISYSSFMDQRVSEEDLIGIAMCCFVPSLLMSVMLYTPALHWLRKRRSKCGPVKLFVLTCAVLLNLPAFSVLGYSAARGGFFGAGEAWYFVVAYVAGGAVYGLGYAWHCGKSAG